MNSSLRKTIAGIGAGLVASTQLLLSIPAVHGFSDVDSSHWAKMYIDNGVSNGFFDGTAATFRPDAGLNRAELAKLTYKLSEMTGVIETDGNETPSLPTGPYTTFTDVPTTAWFAPYVYQLTSQGVMSGYKNADGTSTGKFGPADTVTRAQAVKAFVMAGGFEIPESVSTASFPDVPTSHWAAGAVEVAKEECIIGGYANGNFGPNDPVTRAQSAKVIDRSLNPTCEDVTNGNSNGSNGNSNSPVVTGPISVSLGSNSPAAGTLVAGQARAKLATFTFTGNATLTNLKLKRIGVSSDDTLSSIYLYDGATRLTDNASVSTGIISFNEPSGLFTVNGSKTISVEANIATGTSGQTVGVMVDSFMSGDVSGSGAPSGALHTIASVTDFGTIDFASSTTPSTATITAQPDYTMWQNNVTVGVRKVWLKSIAFRQIGSVLSGDLSNFRLYIDGVQRGSTMTSLDSRGYLTFDFNASPIELSTGSRTIKLVGDIINGSNRNFSFSVQQAADASFVDSQYNASILPTAASSTFSARTSGTQSIDTGTLQVIKRTDSPSGDVVKDASNQVLARYDLKAYGEKMKVESFRVRVDDDDDSTEFTLRNGALYLDGNQIGSTKSIAADTDTTLGYTEFTFGSSAIVTPGTPRILEIRTDIYDNDGNTNNVAADDTLQIEVGAGTSNVQRLTSLGYATAPSSYAEANTVTVKTGTVTMTKNTAVGDATFVAPAYGRLLGSFNIQASATEGSTLTNVEVDTTEADAFDVATDVTNLYIKLGTYTSPIKPTITDDDNNFSVNVGLTAAQSITLEVYGDVASGSTDGDATADTIVVSPDLTYTTVSSGTSTTTGAATGQTFTSSTGSLAISKDGTSPLNRIVAGNQEVTAGIFKFQATNDTFTVQEVDVTVPAAAAASAITAIKLFDGATPVGPVNGLPFTGDDADSGTSNKAAFTGLNWAVSGTKYLTVKAVLNTIGTGAGTSQQNAKVQLDRTKYINSIGTVTNHTTDYDANEMYVYKSIPTFSVVDLNNSTLIMGTATDLYKFTVSASASGNVALKQFKVNVTWSDGGTADTLEVDNLKLYEDGVNVTSNVTIVDEDGDDVTDGTGVVETGDGLETLTVTWTDSIESSIPAGSSKTYTIRGTPSGFRATGADTVGDSVTFDITGDTTHNGSSTYQNDETDIGAGQSEILELFTSAAAAASDGTAAKIVWSDLSSNAHTTTKNATSSADWANGYKVLDLDLPGETWTK